MADATVIDSLLITLGLDTKEVQTGLASIDLILAHSEALAADFIEGLKQGLAEGGIVVDDLLSAADTYADEIVEANNEAKQTLNEVTAAADEAGTAIENAGEKGSSGMNEAAKGVEKLKNTIKETKPQASMLGHEVAQGMKQIVKSIIGPMAIFVALKQTISGVVGELGELDALEKKKNLTSEETIQKQKLLDKYGRDGLEGYRKGRDALNQIRDAMTRAAWPIVQAVIPALKIMADKLSHVVEWAQKNEKILITFFATLAAIVMAKVVPAFAAFAATLLANPLTWIGAAIVALFVIFDDLITYANEGESAFQGFWEMLGTPEEIKSGLQWVSDKIEAIIVATKSMLSILPSSVAVAAGLDAREFEKQNDVLRPQLSREEAKKQDEERAQKYRSLFIDSFAISQGLDMGAAEAVPASVIAPTTNNTDQSQTTINNNVTVNNSTPEATASWVNEDINRRFANNFNFGDNQAGGR